MDAKIHIYHPKRRLLLFEYLNTSNTNGDTTSQPPNILLFVGGMYDNFRSPRYVDDLAALFPRDAPNQKWSVMHVQLTSAGRGWGLSDLDKDVSLPMISLLEANSLYEFYFGIVP